MALFDPKDMSAPLGSAEQGASNSIINPFYDPDTGVAFLAGKGDGNIMFYEISKEAPYFHFLNAYRSSEPQVHTSVWPGRLCSPLCSPLKVFSLVLVFCPRQFYMQNSCYSALLSRWCGIFFLQSVCCPVWYRRVAQTCGGCEEGGNLPYAQADTGHCHSHPVHGSANTRTCTV
jgi:hypothetical protein